MREPAKRPANGRSGAHRGEEDDLPNTAPPGEDHDQPVDAHSHPAGGRHAVLERAEEVLVERLGLLVSGGGLAALLLEASALLVRIVQLRERVAELDAPREGLPPFDESRLAAVRLRERRQLDRVVDDERRALELR